MKRFLPVLLLPLLISSARADVKPMELFGDHMVLQRDKPIAVFGTADANEPVRVSIGLKEAATVADASGKWRVSLPPMQSGPLAYDLTIAGRDAAKTVVLHDVAIGEVWLCSGQSNMWFPLKGAQNAQAEIASTDDPQLRLFTVARPQAADAPRSDVKGHWVATTPATVAGFSAAAYFFGRELRQKLGVPIGLIHSSVGGTAAESWTSRTMLDSNPQLAAIGEKFRAHFQKLQAVNVEYKRSLAEWQLKADAAKAANQPEPEGKPVKPPHENANTSELYNGMIAPLAPFSIRGVIWYQGESNAGRAAEYRTLFPAMIADWRQTFAQGDFPFIYVQLANHDARQDPTQPSSDNSGWASLREAQRLTLSVPNTGMAVILDTSSDGNLHPPEKQPVGHRLALWALKSVYNQDVPQSGPLFQSAALEGNQIRLKFSHTDGGLMTMQPLLIADNSSVVPTGHWAYAAMNKLVEFNIFPAALYANLGNAPFTRQRMAMIVAMLPPYVDKWIAARKPAPTQDITDAQVRELVNALQTEFRDELGRLGVRFPPMEDRLTSMENRVTAPPRQAPAPSAAVNSPNAQPADYPDVPQGSWTYSALRRLVRAGIIEDRNFLYSGPEPLTRYEFAVAVRRLIEKINSWEIYKIGPDPLQPKPNSDITRAQVLELINALQTEFRDELGRMGTRVTSEERLTTLEGRATAPPRHIFKPSDLHRNGGYTNYITQEGGRAIFDASKPVQGFAIAGVDKKFVWADAKIDGDSVVVWSAQVAQPVWVRYAWADNPIGNLYNGAGLPASSFEAQVAGEAGK